MLQRQVLTCGKLYILYTNILKTLTKRVKPHLFCSTYSLSTVFFFLYRCCVETLVPGFRFLLYTTPHCINIFILLMFQNVMQKYSNGASNYNYIMSLISSNYQQEWCNQRIVLYFRTTVKTPLSNTVEIFCLIEMIYGLYIQLLRSEISHLGI